jgi:hypothetical protein
MGYKRKFKTFVLEFEDREYSGLEVEMRSLPLGEFLRLSKIFESDDKTDEQVEEMFRLFAKALVSWNMEDDGNEPIPATYASVLDLDLDFVLTILGAWIDGVASVAPTLGKDSNSGATSLVPSLPMEAL